jgi:hypothetical protein
MTTKPDLAHSPTWERLFNGPLGQPENIDLSTFRSSAPVFSITAWDPEKNGLKYLKTMLYQLLIPSPAIDFDLYKKIKSRDVGNPITVRVKEVDVCLDYFQALHEVKMIRSCIIGSSALRVVEIGSGYGRTCHTALSLTPEIGEYWLIDLAPSLALARRYLSEVLEPEQFQRVRFVTAQEFSEKHGETPFDLAINIDSFGDMPPAVVAGYLGFIGSNCNRFFCKNPLGKYLENLAAATSPSVVAALETGILRTVIDIYDATVIAESVPNFLAAYLPGDGWEVEVACMASPWSYYHQAMYRRNVE